MKKEMASLILLFSIIPGTKLKAQDPISLIIKEGITKVIKAVDLRIQRLQTKTIWLLDAQKVAENAMSKYQLDEITCWVEKQRQLYSDYFEELKKAKQVLAYYYKVREITELQLALVKEYNRGLNGVRHDIHFEPAEVNYIGTVYSGIIEESLKNLDALCLVVNSFTTQMTDEKRMEIMDSAKKAIQKNYDDLKKFSAQNLRLSLARAKDQHEISVIKNLYGIQ